jgi:hypothetical protein
MSGKVAQLQRFSRGPCVILHREIRQPHRDKAVLCGACDEARMFPLGDGRSKHLPGRMATVSVCILGLHTGVLLQ